ncbi:alkane 1-monooxygenase [Pelagovum pacificum]|uniref:Alkane 1-monooxygenase n=1 Tax=Pelagovum pacificum TaxID=2588711 RepID=A0A5C5GGC0_9RHOB|nr:alkane 1-monooxygenase [Pelagovum pacificum]QQA43058.1 alkane 1-monooxygenase [Pelagovum pacificum]TNY33798.1 alkane 1-monooxygenase [Pelagovum pacificum]
MTDISVPARLSNALPFWLSLALVPLPWIGAVFGGWTIALAPVCTWYLFSLIDSLTGLNEDNVDPMTEERELFWYRLIVMIWAPVQFLLLFSLLAYVPRAEHLTGWEKFWVFFGTGVLTGTVGIVYSHELLHQRNRLERWLGDLLLAMVLYSHFRSEHLLVHHRHVGTPRDPVTARYNEGFHRFYPRVLYQSLVSAFRAEKAMLARKKLPWHDRSNPFWRYWALQGAALLLALIVGGWVGLLLFIVQAGTAIWTLELTNYVEHYGLTRKHLGEGRYEHVMPRHSWNANHKATNWLLINLQRHSDHHYKPDRRFPLLQSYSEADAPQLPYGYPLMAMFAMIPPVWRRIMNPKVRRWRQMYYPEITDWEPYKRGTLPLPRG